MTQTVDTVHGGVQWPLQAVHLAGCHALGMAVIGEVVVTAAAYSGPWAVAGRCIIKCAHLVVTSY